MSKAIKPRIRVSSKGWTRQVQVPKPPAQFRASVYEAAGAGPRSSSWQQAGLIGPVSLIGKSLDTLRNRVRYQVRNDPIASRVVDFLVGKVIGGGLRPMLRPGLEDPKFSRVMDAWMDQCDAEGTADLFGIQEIVLRDAIAGGDVLARFRPRDPEKDKDLVVPMQIQVLAGEMMPSHDPTGESVSGVIRNGIGRAVAYKIFKKHPGERLGGMVDMGHSYVDAKDCAHVFWKREPGQVRGEPWLTRGLITLHDLDSYQDAELVRKKMAAMPVFFIQTPTDMSKPSAPVGVSDGTDGHEEGTPLNADGTEWSEEDPVEQMPELGPGAVVPVAPGYEVKPSLPADVGPQYDTFVRRQLQRVCAAVNAPYELITGDTPPGANERMMRIRLNDFYTLVKIWRRMMVRQFCQPAWRAAVMAAYDSGAWEPKEGTTLEDYLTVDWVGDPIALVNPEQETRADVLAVRAGFKTMAQVIRERGGDPDTVMAARSAEIRKGDSLGLIYETDPRYVSSAGVTQSRQGEFVLPDDGGDGDPDEKIDL